MTLPVSPASTKGNWFVADNVFKAGLIVLPFCIGLLLLWILNSIGAAWFWMILGWMAYAILVVERSHIVLALIILAFTDFLGLVPSDLSLGSVKPQDILIGLAVLPLGLFWVKDGFPLRGHARRRALTSGLILLTLVSAEVAVASFASGQGIWDGVKAGKSFLYYGAFIIVPFYLSSKENCRQLFAWFTAVALALASLLLIVSFLGAVPGVLPGLRTVEAGFVGLGTFTRVTNRGFPLVFAMLLYHLYALRDERTSLRRIGIVLWLAAGALVTFYRALWIGVFAALIAQVCVEGRRGVSIFVRGLTILLVGLLLLALINPTNVQMVLQRAESSFHEVQDRSGSYKERYHQIQTWLPVLRDNLFCGVGFLHPESKEGMALQAVNSMESTGTLDVGWVDLLGRVGILGTFAMAVFLMLLCGNVFRRESYTGSTDLVRLRRTVFSLLVVGVVSLPGAALLSWEGGSIIYGMLLGILLVLDDKEQSGSAGD